MADHVRSLLRGVLDAVRQFAPGVGKLRIVYVFEPTWSDALGAHVSQELINNYQGAGLVEEARIANETGPGREAVLLSCLSLPTTANSKGTECMPSGHDGSGAARDEEPPSAPRPTNGAAQTKTGGGPSA